MNFKGRYRLMSVLMALVCPVSTFAVDEQTRTEIYTKFAEKVNCSFEDLSRLLNFKSLKNGKPCYLIPLYSIDEHKQCMIDLFAKQEEDNESKQEYMKYYLDYGSKGLPSKEDVEERHYTKVLERIWSNEIPKSLHFVIDTMVKVLEE